MSNHFHLLIETPLGNLSEFMRHFNIRYTSHFNIRHKRSGHLYQGRYKGILVDKEAYLTILSRYIHLNPVRIKGMKGRPSTEKRQHLQKYRWSSLPGYINKRNNGFDLVVDCSGNPKAIEQAIHYLNPMGKFLLFGICPQNSTININPFQVFQKELTILGSVINPYSFPKSIN